MADATTAWARSLRYNLTLAKQADNVHLRVLTDAAGHKMATKMYHQYVSDADYSKMPAFIQDLDRLLAKYGAATGGKKNQEDDDTDSSAADNASDNSDGQDQF